MIDREHDLPITKQAKVLRISRGSVYYLPRPVSATDLEVMRRLDRLHLRSTCHSRVLFLSRDPQHVNATGLVKCLVFFL